MTLEHIYFVSQSVAAVAVVVSLIFLGLQVRHTNRESLHRSAEESLQKLREIELEMAADADRAGVWLSGLHDFGALSPVSKVRFLLIAHMVLKTNESFFVAFRDGRLTREMYEPEEQHMREFLGYPGIQAAWSIRRHYFHEPFQRWVEEKISAAKKEVGMPFLYREEPTSTRNS
jgi:hypothetical protein